MASVTLSIAASGDDYYFDNNAFPPVETDGTTTIAAAAGLQNHDAHLRFACSLPAGTIIDSASISFVAHGSSATAVTLRLTAHDLFTGTFNPWPTPGEIASIDVSVPSWNSGDRVALTGPLVTSLIQAMLVHPNYAPGRYLTFRMARVGGVATAFTFKAYEAGASLASHVEILYSSGPVASGVSPIGTLGRNRRNRE